MKSRSTAFVGQRLREAREARGLTITSLSETLGRLKQSISAYEKGQQSPNPEFVQLLANKLNLPLHFFFRQDIKEYLDTTIFYRSINSATKGARISAEWKLSWLKDIVSFLREYIVFPVVNFPAFEMPKDPLSLTDQDIESYAAECRRFWGLGSGIISNVMVLMENKGAIITRCNFQSEALDAFSQWSNTESTPYIFISSNKNSAVRSRFDIAHELGHLVMHRHIDRSTAYKPAEFKSIEKQAYRFAAAFLLPAESFANDLTRPTLDNFWALKERWKVSIAMMIMRCEQLNIVGEDFVPKLWINYNRRGWRKQEPLDDKLTIETPKYLRMCIEMLINEGVQSRDDILAKLPYSSYDIEDLLGLPSGYMSPRVGNNITYLPVLRTTKGPDKNTIRDGKVVPFKRTDDYK